ncbi:unnamed protein product [Prunus armeniaca]|uniref:Uncharacterized protein n=1 Tax=Prunus armeniaca TaxID=36596 RepID=A0A6J5WN83_PRUAR|nr:unnamed protein product [Prunus armeniaca]
MKRRLSNEEEDQMNEPIRTTAATNEINGRKKARSSFNNEAMGERASQNWVLRFPRRDENMLEGITANSPFKSQLKEANHLFKRGQNHHLTIPNEQSMNSDFGSVLAYEP